MSLRGYTAPLSPDGRAGIVPPPPWHYSGDFLIAEYRTDPDAVAALLPLELEPAEDPGAVAAIVADWQSCSVDMHERSVQAFALGDGNGPSRIVPVSVPVEPGDPLARELSDFVAAVRERRDPLVSGEVGRDALVLAERVREAIAEHRGRSGADAR